MRAAANPRRMIIDAAIKSEAPPNIGTFGIGISLKAFGPALPALDLRVFQRQAPVVAAFMPREGTTSHWPLRRPARDVPGAVDRAGGRTDSPALTDFNQGPCYTTRT